MTDMLNIETGCHIDGYWGIYSIERLYDLADSLVADDKKPNDWTSIGQIIHHSLHGDQDETITTDTGEQLTVEDTYDITADLYDEITELLPTDPGHSWVWSDGELFYWSDDDLDENEE